MVLGLHTILTPPAPPPNLSLEVFNRVSGFSSKLPNLSGNFFSQSLGQINEACKFSEFSEAVYYSPRSPKRLTTKKIEKCLYLFPTAFLSKNKVTFIRQTFHFLSESILVFFSFFDQKRPTPESNSILKGILSPKRF